MKKGDVVLFVPLLPQPVPRGKLRMYTVGFVVAATQSVVFVVDVCGVEHVAYTKSTHIIHTAPPTAD